MDDAGNEGCEGIEVDDMESNGDKELCHPLMNSVILRNIFQYSCVKDLKNIRLVCSLWDELASPYLQQKSLVVLREELFREGASIKSFINYVNQECDLERLFFQNYKITLQTIDKQNEDTIQFWERVGPSMQSLEMSWCRFKGIEMVRNVMFRWTKNLKHFSLRDCTFYKDEKESYVVEYEVAEYDPFVTTNRKMKSLEFYGGESRVGPPISWREVIIAYPNLQQLLLNNLNIHGINDILSEINTIRRNDPSKLNINKLNIFNGDFAFGQLTAPVAQLLMDLNLPITHLNLDVGLTTSDLIMASLLKTFSKTLQHLTMYRGPFAIPFVMFPFEITMPELLSLELSESITSDFNFAFFMPKLRQLSICESPDSEPPILPTDMIMNTDSVSNKFLSFNLQKLRLDYDCSLGDVRKLVRWFPNMKSLRMYLTDSSFRLICGEWKDLEELEILGDKVTDEGITGLTLTSLDSQYVVTKKSLSIRNMLHLHKFVMKNYGISTTISDISVHQGFCMMPRLYHLELCSNLISDDGWKLLHSMPNLSILLPSDGAWESKCSSFAKGMY